MIKIQYLFILGFFTTARLSYAQEISALARDTGIAPLYSLLAKVGVHPEVEIAQAAVTAAAHRIAMNASMPNPMLMLGVENLPTNSFRFSEDPMTSKMIGLTQDFPFPGKLKAEAEIAAQDTTTMGVQLSEKENDLAHTIKDDFFELYHLSRAIAVNEFHVKTVNHLISLAQHTLTTGSTNESNVLDLTMERSDMETTVLQERMEFAMEVADIERASGIPFDTSTIPESLALPEFSYTLAQLDTFANRHSPLIIELRSEAEQQELRAQRADLEKFPDFQASLEYMQRDALLGAMPQSNMVSAGVSIELPIEYGNQREEAIDEARTMEIMKHYEETATELDLHAKLQAALAKITGLKKEYDLLRNEIYPNAKLSIEAAHANYTYGKTTIDQVLREDLALMHREHDRYRLEAEYNEAIASIEYLTGMRLVRYSTANDWK